MINVRAEIDRLNTLTVRHLKAEFERLWGEPTRSHNKTYLVKRIVWRLQAMEQGDLTDRARTRAAELARDVDLRVRPLPEVHRSFEGATGVTTPLMPKPGTVLRRLYRGRTHEVEVLTEGFRYEGKVYRSLTAVANEIAGIGWNGKLFFGLTPRRRVKESA